MRTAIFFSLVFALVGCDAPDSTQAYDAKTNTDGLEIDQGPPCVSRCNEVLGTVKGADTGSGDNYDRASPDQIRH